MAKHYLLLRRNKQTGPYTIDELQKLPLEPFDLVWIEGVSDSWKHPGEIDELRSFAPYTSNLRYNFNVKKPGGEELRPTQPAVQLPADKNYLPEEKPAMDTPQQQNTRSTPNSTDRSVPSASTQKKESVYPRVQPRFPENKSADLKKTALWAIPIGLLFFLGLWIGFNWNKFPANEGVAVPLTNNDSKEKNGAAIYEERKSGVITPDNATSGLSVPNEPVTDNTQIEEESAELITDESASIGQEMLDDEVNGKAEQVEEEKPAQIINDKKIFTPGTSKINKVPEVASANDAKRKTLSASSVKSAGGTKSETQKAEADKVVTKKYSEVIASTPSTTIRSDTRVAAKTNQEDRNSVSGAKASTNNQVSLKKDQKVPDSYMSKKLVPVDHLVEVDGNYKKNEDGNGVKEVDFTVYNRSGKYLKAVKLEVQYFGRNNTLLKKQNMKFYNISSDGAVKLDADAHNNAERIGYKVLYISSTIGDFYYEPVEFLSSVSR